MLIMVSSYGLVIAQETEVRNLEKFTKVNISGNAEVRLIKSTKSSVKIEFKKMEDLKKYVSEVRNGELFLYRQKESQKDDEPNVIIYLMHTGIENLDLSGIVNLFSEDVLQQSELTINGSGIIGGQIQVSVQDLNISLSGISNMRVSGKADNAEFNADGMGKINAKDLETNKAIKNADGFARVKLARS